MLNSFYGDKLDVFFVDQTGAAIALPDGSKRTLDEFASGVIIGGGTKLSKLLTATAALDFPSIAAAASADLTISVPGVTVNSSVSLGLPAAPTAGLIYQAFVSAADVITVRATNITAAAVDAVSQTVRVTALVY